MVKWPHAAEVAPSHPERRQEICAPAPRIQITRGGLRPSGDLLVDFIARRVLTSAGRSKPPRSASVSTILKQRAEETPCTGSLLRLSSQSLRCSLKLHRPPKPPGYWSVLISTMER